MNLKSMLDYACLKTAAVVGTGIHLYSVAINNDHFRSIANDFSEGHWVRGSLKASVPFLLPYAVSLYARKKAQRESAKKIEALESKVKELTEQ